MEHTMSRHPCPYLKGEVELTDEREHHIAERHPDLLPEHRDRIADTLAEPDQVRSSARFGSAKLFSRWYYDVRRGKHVVVVVVSEPDRVNATGSSRRTWRESSRKERWNGDETDV
jgi:hypothetical protein